MEFAVRETPIEITTTTLILGLLGLALVGYGGYDYVQQSAAIDDAVEVEVTVVETSLTEEDSGRSGIRYDADVEFTYQYQGTEYTSDKRFPGSFSKTYNTRSAAESALEPYDEGNTVTAYVDPASPGEGFLERRTSQGPLQFIAIGCVVLLVISLDAVGARNPGQGTELQAASDHEPTRYQTLFGADRDTVNQVSKRLIKWAVVVLPLSLIGVVGILLISESGSGGSPPQRQVGLLDPLGLLLAVAFLAVLVLIGAIALYGVWSFTEYRRLRERILEPRPPSPFRHPTRLVTILLGNDDLDDYGKRVKRTGFAFVVAVFLVGVVLNLLVI
jgi:hypothetical protein